VDLVLLIKKMRGDTRGRLRVGDVRKNETRHFECQGNTDPPHHSSYAIVRSWWLTPYHTTLNSPQSYNTT